MINITLREKDLSSHYKNITLIGNRVLSRLFKEWIFGRYQTWKMDRHIQWLIISLFWCLGMVSLNINVAHSAPANIETIILEDDFNDGVIDSNKWITTGNTVTEEDGVLNLQADVTDHVGDARTVEFEPVNKMKLEVVHTMHNNTARGYYYFPLVSFGATDASGSFSIIWQRSDYGNDNCNVSDNYNKVMVSGFEERCFSVSNITSSNYYDQQLTSVISYDTGTGIISLDIDNDGVVDFSATAPEGKRYPIQQIGLSTYGWWTGHSHKFDNIKLISEDVAPGINVSKVEPTEAIKNSYSIFTVTGADLKDGSIKFDLPGCLPTDTEYEPESATSTQRQFRCMPTAIGGKVGRIYSTADDKLLKIFHVRVLPKPPKVTKVTPATARFGEDTLFTVTGSNLVSDMQFVLNDCDNSQEVGAGTTTKRYFQCTPKNSEGSKSGSVSLKDSTQLKQFSVNVNSQLKVKSTPAKLKLSFDKVTKLIGSFPIGITDLYEASSATNWFVKINGQKIYSGLLGDGFETQFGIKKGSATIELGPNNGFMHFSWDKKTLNFEITNVYSTLISLFSSLQQNSNSSTVDIEIGFGPTKAIFTTNVPSQTVKQTGTSKARWSYQARNLDDDNFISNEALNLRKNLVEKTIFPSIERKIDLLNAINLNVITQNDALNKLAENLSTATTGLDIYKKQSKGELDEALKIGLKWLGFNTIDQLINEENGRYFAIADAFIKGIDANWDCIKADYSSCLIYWGARIKDVAVSLQLNNNLEKIYAHRIAKEFIKQYLANNGNIYNLSAQLLPSNTQKTWENTIKAVASNMECRAGVPCTIDRGSEDYEPFVVNTIIQNNLGAIRSLSGYGEYN